MLRVTAQQAVILLGQPRPWAGGGMKVQCQCRQGVGGTATRESSLSGNVNGLSLNQQQVVGLEYGTLTNNNTYTSSNT